MNWNEQELLYELEQNMETPELLAHIEELKQAEERFHNFHSHIYSVVDRMRSCINQYDVVTYETCEDCGITKEEFEHLLRAVRICAEEVGVSPAPVPDSPFRSERYFIRNGAFRWMVTVEYGLGTRICWEQAFEAFRSDLCLTIREISQSIKESM